MAIRQIEPAMLKRTFIFIVLFTLFGAISSEETWTGKWFPEVTTKSSIETKINQKYQEVLTEPNVTSSNKWKGNWFPAPPKNESTSYEVYEKDRIMGIPNSNCDDGETNLSTDFDPQSYDHQLMYICLESTYKPSVDFEPIQTVYEVPTFYTPVHLCMNVTITYDQRIPILGYHRPLWPAYGEYGYLPPQRWLHSLEHGAVVALYHPCANKQQVEKLKRIVKSCLYRHIITPYNKLSHERPLALAAWGTSLEFSVTDKQMVVEFIQKYAKTGPEKVSRDGQYKQLLAEPSKIITDVDDAELCPKQTE